jgi:hypothetical protein
VNGRGITLMEKVQQQLDDAVLVFAAADDMDLNKHCADEEGGATSTVAGAAAHLAEGYIRLGRFLHSTGFVPTAPAAPGRGHGENHRDAPSPRSVADVLALLQVAGRPVVLLGGLTDEQLDSVPAKANRFADGHRTLLQVLEDMAAHQAAHLAAVRRALA